MAFRKKMAFGTQNPNTSYEISAWYAWNYVELCIDLITHEEGGSMHTVEPLCLPHCYFSVGPQKIFPSSGPAHTKKDI